MIRAKICFAALAVVRDADTNGISAFNILEGITGAGMPFLIQNVSFFVLWERDLADPERVPGTFTVTLNGQALTTQQVTIDFQGRTANRTTVNLNGLIISTPGTLNFRLALEVGAVAEYHFDVQGPPAAVQVQGVAANPH